jgi:hypothetical protein
MSEQSLLVTERPSPSSERSYAKIYERLRDTIDGEIAVGRNSPNVRSVDWPHLHRLLDAEHLAWGRAYGSAELRQALDRGVLDGGALQSEWLAQQRGSFGNTRGELHARRPPGDAQVRQFLMVADPERGGVKPAALNGDLLKQARVRLEIDNLVDQARRLAPDMQPTHFLATHGEHAWFVMREPNSGERKVVGVGHLRRPGVAAELAGLAMQPKEALGLLRDVEREHLRGRVRANYGPRRELQEVPRDVVVQGRVDGVLTDKQEKHALVLPPRAAVHHAVVVTPDAVHLVRVGAGEQAKQQAQQLLGRHVELSRSSEGMRLSLSRGFDRAIGTLWAKAREEGLGR